MSRYEQEERRVTLTGIAMLEQRGASTELLKAAVRAWLRQTKKDR